jgi:hypothetical protein
MGVSEFIEGLEDLGFQARQLEGNRIEVMYSVPCGSFIGREIRLGFEIPGDFPLTPPSGPHISPHLRPMNPGAPGHPDRTADSPFGSEWQYWSRPFPNWAGTDRTVKTYMAHVRHLFDTQ